MKTIVAILLILLVLPFTVRSDSYLTTGATITDEAILTLDADWGGLTTCDSISSWYIPSPKRPSDPAYFHHLDSHLVRVRVACDTTFKLREKIHPGEDEDFEPYWQYQLDQIRCDTFYRWDYDSVMAPKEQVYLDSLMWFRLRMLLEPEIWESLTHRAGYYREPVWDERATKGKWWDEE